MILRRTSTNSPSDTWRVGVQRETIGKLIKICFECDQGHQIRFLLAINLRIKPATILKHAITNVLQITERKAYLIRKLHIYVYIYNVYLYLYKSSNKLQRCSTKLVMWVPNLGWPHKFSMQQKNRKFEPWYQQQTNFIWKTCFDSSSHHPTIETNYLDIKEPTKIEHITHSIYRFPEELDVFFCVCPIWIHLENGKLVGGIPTPLKIWVCQWEGLSHMKWKIKVMFETTNQGLTMG